MTATTVNTHPAPSDEQLDAIKIKQQATWASGDFAVVGTTLQLTGELLCEAIGIEAGWQVLDVAAGNGNVALAAARRFADVTASDYVPELLAKAAARARADGIAMTTQVADAEALPFADASFDAATSAFGVMFAPRQQQVANELLRVSRPGGRIGVINWTPGSFVAQMFATVSKYIPPAPVASPFNWGDLARVEQLFGRGATITSAMTHEFPFRYRSAQHFVDVFRAYYGPTHKAFAALDDDGRHGLERDLVALAREWNRSTSGALMVPGEYLEVVAVRQ